MLKRKIVLSDSDSEVPPRPSPADTPPPEAPPTATTHEPPSKRARKESRRQASLAKLRKCEYMKRPEDRSKRKFRAYFRLDEQQHQILQQPRSLKRFEEYDRRMQKLRSAQRSERSISTPPWTVKLACHVCGASPPKLLQCQMRISKQKAWRGKPPERYTSKTWWLKARASAERWTLHTDRARGIFAVLKSHWLMYKRARTMTEHSIAMGAPVDFIHDFFNPAPFLSVKPNLLPETTLTSATPATLAFLQECGRYVCMDCCVRERMPRNLDLQNDSYCLACYHRGTRREDYARYEQAQLERTSLAYRENRPLREEKAERRLPKPSTLLTERNTNALWYGGTGRQLIRRAPLDGKAYTHSEINGLLKTVENFFYNCTARFQVMYTVEPDMSRPWALTYAECLHHFGAAEVSILMRYYAVAPNDTFVLPEQLEHYAENGESDEEGEADCELSD